MQRNDNRHNEKRRIMSEIKRKNGFPSSNCPSNSSSARCAMVDLMDSSDEPRFLLDRSHGGRIKSGWAALKVAPQQRNFTMPSTHKYTDEIDENNEYYSQMQASDFCTLSQLPPTVGQHFKFAAEKCWEHVGVDESGLLTNNSSRYFTLNMRLLNSGLLTIQFHKRMDYSTSMFNKEQLATMDVNSEVAEKIFQDVLRKHAPKSQFKTANNGDEKGKSTGNRGGLGKYQASSALPVTLDEPVDELLNRIAMQERDIGIHDGAAIRSMGTSAIHVDNIQQWLDNVLEE